MHKAFGLMIHDNLVQVTRLVLVKRLSLIKSLTGWHVELALIIFSFFPSYIDKILMKHGLKILIFCQYTLISFSFNRSIRTCSAVLLLLLSRKLISVVHVWVLKFVLHFTLIYFQFFFNKLIIVPWTFWQRHTIFFMRGSNNILVVCVTILR